MSENTKNSAKIPADIAAMSFEEALTALQEIVKGLERMDNKLEEAIASYERGALLKRHCESKLREAQMKVEKIILGPLGPTGTEPADLN